MSWQDILRELQIDPTAVETNLDQAVSNPDLATEIEQLRKDAAKENPRVKAEFRPPEIPWEGEITLHLLFDPDDVADEKVQTLKLNDVVLDVVNQSPARSTRTPEGHPKTEWVIQGHPKNPELFRYLRRSSSYSLEGSLGNNRTFTAFLTL
jgi:hypothetical protein